MDREYISRNGLLRHLADWWLTESPTENEILFINGEPQTTPAMKVIEECMKAVEQQPTADVVEVVRCKNCRSVKRDKATNTLWCGIALVSPEHFCSHGLELREVEG